MDNPGNVLEQKLKDAGISRKELSQRIDVSEKLISTVISGDHAISSSFARKLGYVFENTSYWLKLQAEYDDEQAKIRDVYSISTEEIGVLKPLHDIMVHLIEKGYIHNNCGDAEKVMQLRTFLGVSDLLLIPNVTYNAAYRAQLSTNIKVDPFVLFAWQRLCEKETEKINLTAPLNKELLKENIPEIKSMMFGEIDDGVRKIQQILSKCGIAFEVVKNFRGAPVQGFIKEFASQNIILCLTIRGKRADRFWFTLFHEIAHILNDDFKHRFVDFDSIKDETEAQADALACEMLIEPSMYKSFIHSGEGFTWPVIVKWAKKMHIEPFILLGRLQNDSILDWTDYTEKVVYYEWA